MVSLFTRRVFIRPTIGISERSGFALLPLDAGASIAARLMTPLWCVHVRSAGAAARLSVCVERKSDRDGEARWLQQPLPLKARTEPGFTTRFAATARRSRSSSVTLDRAADGASRS